MLNKTIDIIITTFNRAEKVQELVFQLLAIIEQNVKVIVVDSSDKINSTLQQINEIYYLRSSHKNQPYQRYLGFLTSQSDIIIFLDDDMEIVENKFVPKISKLFDNNELVSVAIKFKDKNKETSLSKIPTSKFLPKNRLLKNIKGWLTGYPILKPGEFGLCGNKGPQPEGGGITEWVSGGAYAARHSVLFQNFNFQLFDIFESHMGMGEDGIIGYGLSRIGRVVYHDELLFLHNDQRDSTYKTDILAFAKRVAFSRLYLSLERARLSHRSTYLARIHYHYFMFWRIAGLFLNFIINPSTTRWNIFKGTLSGLFIAFSFKFSEPDDRSRYWHSEAACDKLSLI